MKFTKQEHRDRIRTYLSRGRARTVLDLVNRTGLSVSTIRKYLRDLRREGRLKTFERDGGWAYSYNGVNQI